MALAIFVLLVTLVVSAEALWTSFNNAFADTVSVAQDTPLVIFETFQKSICVYDPLEIRIATESSNSPEILICVQSELFNMTYVHRRPHSAFESIGVDEQDRVSAVIRCLLNEEYCVPRVDSLAVKEVQNGVLPFCLVVRFEQDTNQPQLNNAAQLQAALDFEPPILGLMAAHWIDLKTLHVFIDLEAYTTIIEAHKKSEPISVTPKLIDLTNNAPASLSLRFGSMDVVHVYAINATTRKVVSEIHDIAIVRCDDFLAFGKDSRYSRGSASHFVDKAGSGSNGNENSPPRPLYRLGGVAAISGKHPVVIPDPVAPVMGQGDWALSFWLYLVDPPERLTGDSAMSHRALFYKGDSTASTGRTPSVWLLPDRNRMTIRVSTEMDADLAVESLIDIPSFRWTLISFVFSNTSKPSVHIQQRCRDAEDLKNAMSDAESKGVFISTELEYYFQGMVSDECGAKHVPAEPNGLYNIKVYVDGDLDISATFRHNVLGNNESLWLFKDPSHGGPRGFAADITLWDGLLTPGHVSTLVEEGYPDAAEGVVKAVQLLNSSAASYADDFVETPTVLRSLLYPTGGLIDIGSLRRKTSLKVSSTREITSGRIASLRSEEAENTCVLNGDDCTTTPNSISMAQISQSYLDIPVSSLTVEIDDVLAETLHSEATAAYQSCEDSATRLDRYAAAVVYSRGSKTYGENLYKWAMLKAFGVEAPDTKCGVSASRNSGPDFRWGESHGDSHVSLRDQIQAFRALIRAMASGYANAIPVIVTFINSGSAAVPAFVEYFGSMSESHPLFNDFEVQFANLLQQYLSHCENGRKFSVTGKISTAANIQRVQEVDRAIRPADSAFCFQQTDIADASRKNKIFSSDPLLSLTLGLLHVSAMGGVTDIGTSVPEAYMALSYRYQNGIGVQRDVETAGYYAIVSADASSNAFHALGGMPVAETDRIDENTEKTIELGNMGDDDEAIQLQRVRAEEGDVPAMIQMGDLHYFGARGLPRDQPRALEYYNRAAAARNAHGMCCVAAMYLKGEGMDAANGTRAVELYTEAAGMGSVKALNGLGYIYFHGTGGMEVNRTKAFECFLNATLKDEDADSWYNAGYCLQNGFGTEVDLGRAASFYKKAITSYGHFGSAFLLGNMHYYGHGVTRSVPEALYYLKSINALGPWAGWVRRGLDAFLEKNVNHASLCYMHAGEIGGFEVAHSNAAFLLQRSSRIARPPFTKTLWSSVTDVIYPRVLNSLGLAEFNNSARNHSEAIINSTLPMNRSSQTILASGLYHPTALLRQLLLAARSGNSDVMRSIGDVFYNDMYLPFDNIPGSNRSIMWYSRASARGSAMSSLTLAYMHQFGIGAASKNKYRAEKYYSDALGKSSTDTVNSIPMQLLAKTMLWWLRACKDWPWLSSMNTILEEVVAKFDFFEIMP